MRYTVAKLFPWEQLGPAAGHKITDRPGHEGLGRNTGTFMSEANLILTAMALLLIKHAVADFLLQTAYQRATKGIYGALGGLTHSASHILLTAPILLLFFQLSPGRLAAILAAEFVLHYHFDWLKDQAVKRRGWTSHDTPFWWALGLDQLMHGLTYVAIVWLAVQAQA